MMRSSHLIPHTQHRLIFAATSRHVASALHPFPVMSLRRRNGPSRLFAWFPHLPCPGAHAGCHLCVLLPVEVKKRPRNSDVADRMAQPGRRSWRASTRQLTNQCGLLHALHEARISLREEPMKSRSPERAPRRPREKINVCGRSVLPPCTTLPRCFQQVRFRAMDVLEFSRVSSVGSTSGGGGSKAGGLVPVRA